MQYVDRILSQIRQKNVGNAEFIQAAEGILSSLQPVLSAHPEYEGNSLLERFFEPERVITFKVPWMDRNGKIQINTGYRVQFNSAIGAFKGGLRFHPSVNLSVLKFLALEQTLKNSLTGLPMGGAKGGSDFDPKGKTDAEIMSFCQSFMTGLFRYIGADTDIPAGDIGVGAREIGYLFGQYKRLTGLYTGAITGRGSEWGGSLIRKEATGYGLLYITERALNGQNDGLKGKTVVVSGSGNVAIYSVEKAQILGAKVVALSDSDGYVYDENGIDLEVVKQIKEQERGRISEYAKRVKGAKYYEGSKGIWTIPCDVAFPCATQNEIDGESAKTLLKNGVKAVAEGANMPSTPEAVELFSSSVLFLPAKAANAGGVATSLFEMSQSATRMYWTAEEADARLRSVMNGIFDRISTTAEKYGKAKNYVFGANVAGFEKVANAMLAQGAV